MSKYDPEKHNAEKQKVRMDRYLEGCKLVKFRMTKSDRELLKDYTSKNGTSISGFINECVDEILEEN